ncbi:FAD binding domain-containing protein [Paradesulfitobacterium ferrireducens]|uniref:FAD binding domain-containing protein n=1 Tax=Paradesulfitobacterium ferrireducens TaxID=2816476 RepID=UPI001A908E13|nr:xanthine dehydrogenase family protein subunit M [Paradesulfitobacterium ferrireducens]
MTGTLKYETPHSLAELWPLLVSDRELTGFLAGGTDLIVKYKRKQLNLTRFIDLKNIESLKGIWLDENKNLHIGSLTTLTELHTHPLIQKHAPLLAAAARKMASVQIRNRATIGGNLCNAAPSADLAPPLLVLDAVVKLESDQGARELSIKSLFTGPGQTALKIGEVMTEVMVPVSEPSDKVTYLKQGLRQAMDIAMAGVAVKLNMSGNLCQEAAIALGAVAPTPIRVKAAEEWLRGQRINEQSIAKAAELAKIAANPISDVRTTADYRSELVSALVTKAIQECMTQV